MHTHQRAVDLGEAVHLNIQCNLFTGNDHLEAIAPLRFAVTPFTLWPLLFDVKQPSKTFFPEPQRILLVYALVSTIELQNLLTSLSLVELFVT